MDKLKYSRLSCDYVCISYYDTEGNPQQALVNKITLCDYKYQTNHIPVSGTFIEDSFSDAKSSSNESLYDINKNAVSFAHFLMPFDMALWQSVYVNSDTVPSYAVPYRRLYALYGIFQNYEGSAQFIYDEFSKWGEPKKIPYTIMRYLFTNMMASLCDEFGLSDVEYLRGIVDGTKFTRNFVDANNPTWLLLFEDAVNYYLRAIKNTNSDDNRGDGK